MKRVVILFLLLSTGTGMAQTLTLRECYTLAAQNYPLVKQRELIAQSKEYSVLNLSKGFLPQFSINGQATYQSAVTQVPIEVPGMDIPTISKDQYKLYGEVNQSLFDGGIIKQQKQIQQANAEIEEQRLEVELYKVKDRINQLYFGILLTDEQLKQTSLLKNDIELGLRRTEASIENGTAFKSNASILKAELLKVNQRVTELNSMRQAYLDMLGLFLNRTLDQAAKLEKPEPVIAAQEINRPEIQAFNSQYKALDVQNQLISARNKPRFNLFLQAGYGRPALNMLSNDFEAYYLGGLRLNWSLGGLYTSKNERAQLAINRKNIDVQKEVFLFNTSITVKQQNNEVLKYQALLTSDEEIIALRTSVKTTASVQLENGVINTNDYLREVNAEDQARQNKILHEIQLLMAQYTLQTTTGNTL